MQEWWPDCPGHDAAGDSTVPGLPTWRWHSPTLYDLNWVTGSQGRWDAIQDLEEGDVLAHKQHHYRISGRSCSDEPWEVMFSLDMVWVWKRIR